jgi:hypothetical protein
MARPQDWSAVGRSSDPVPGDVALVDELARRYKDTADAIRAGVDGLKRLRDETDGQESDAVEKLRELARDTSLDIEKAEDRYRDAATALSTWADALGEAQRKADGALEAAREVMNAPAPTADEDSDEPPPDPADDPVVVQARGTVTTARSEWDTAGRNAAGAINSAMEANDLNDGWRDKLANVLSKIGDIAGIVATIAGILSLVLCWVPVIGQALAAVALVATAISLVCKLGVGGLTGGWDVMGIVMDTVSLATFGIGRAFSAAARGTSQAAVRTGRSAAMRFGRVAGNGGQPRAIQLMGGHHITSGMVRGYARSGSSGWRGLLGGYTSSFADTRAGFSGIWQGLRGNGWTTSFNRSNPLTSVWGSSDAAADLATAGRFTDELMGISPEAANLRNLANVQNNVSIGSGMIGSSLDTYQFGDLLGDTFDSGVPDVSDATIDAGDYDGQHEVENPEITAPR